MGCEWSDPIDSLIRDCNPEFPYIYVGIHGFFLDINDFQWRRRIQIFPLEHDRRKINYYELFKQQVYIQIFQFVMYKEAEKIDAFQDYSLQLTMTWDEKELQKLGLELTEDYHHGPIFWCGKYLTRNLQASDTDDIMTKFPERTGVLEFDQFDAERIPVAVMI